MKKILSLLILLSALTSGQSGKSVLSQAQKDSIGVIITDSLTNYVDKASTQTITGQKNFTGKLRLGKTSYAEHTLTFNPLYGNSSNWNWYSSEDTTSNGYNDTIPVWTTFSIGSNLDNLNTSDVRSGLTIENNYWTNYANPENPRNYDTEIYFWQTDSNDVGNQVRPFTINITKGTQSSQVAINTEQFVLRGSDYGNFIEIKPPLNEINLFDTIVVSHSINNTGWLKQGGNSAINATGIKLPFINDSNHVDIGNDGYARGIDLGVPLIFKDPLDLFKYPYIISNQVGLYNDEGVLKVKDGFGFTTTLSGNYLPTDTSRLTVGDIWGDVNTGKVNFIVPENLVINGNFTTWTNGYSPDDWTTDTPDTTNFYYENDGDKLHLIQNAGANTTIYQNITQVVGVVYGYEFKVSQIVDTVRVYIGQNNTPVTATGVYHGESTSNATDPIITIVAAYGACEITIDDIRVWRKTGGNVASIFVGGLDAFTTTQSKTHL